MFRICNSSLLQSAGAADVNDLSPNVFLSLALGWLRSKPLFDRRLYLDLSPIPIKLITYSGTRPWIALKVRTSILKLDEKWRSSSSNAQKMYLSPRRDSKDSDNFLSIWAWWTSLLICLPSKLAVPPHSHVHILKLIRNRIGSQRRAYSTGVTWSYLDILQIILAAEFCTRCSLPRWTDGRP